MKNWYDDILADFDMSKVSSESTGMDYFLSESDSTSANIDLFGGRSASTEEVNQGRIRVGSVEQLKGFTRVANSDTLVRMSEQDLWEIKEGDDGEFLIERLFDEDGKPLKV